MYVSVFVSESERESVYDAEKGKVERVKGTRSWVKVAETKSTLEVTECTTRHCIVFLLL